jgi:uncharacterized metal-binding protein (TIGR02443 family)
LSVVDSEQRPKGKFIAGAVCPACQAMDRIVITGDAENGERRCVACGYSDSTAPASGTLPGTRFSKAPGAKRDSRATEAATPVKIITPLQPVDKPSDS